MAMPKAPTALIDHFNSTTDALLGQPGVERRKMFGFPACFTNGNMFTGLHGSNWIVRLAEGQASALTDAGGEHFEPMPGRPMRGFYTLPRRVLDDDRALGTWLERALAHAASMPAKPRRTK
jgi:TfoX/Sxy family transcriptional regulator of competence genes